jgi:membrane protein
LVTTGLFLGGKYLIGLYLGSSAIGTTFGTAASLVIVLIWTYYSAQILLFGAEFTKWYAIYFGSRITTAKTN